MLDNALFRIRSAGVDVWPLLGSWQLSIVLMVTTAFWYVLLAVFAFLSPPHVVQSIAGLAMFWILYALLLVNTAVCLVVRGLKGLAIGTLLFHGSLFLVAAGFVLTVASRYEATYRVAEGEEFTGNEAQIVSTSAPRVLMTTAPSIRFKVEKIVPELWRDQLLFTRLEATLDGGRSTRINRPLVLGMATFLRLSGFGYTPRYEILDARGNLLESEFAKLTIFPPGRRDFIASANFPFRFYVTAGDLSATMFDVKIYRGRLLLAERVVRRTEPLEFEGLVFRIADMRYWGEFTLVRDAGAPLILLGAIIGIAGLCLKLWRRA
ncbi:MAG: hypothetical protein ACYC7A_08945 [Thermoanaerobaculia bacterium]